MTLEQQVCSLPLAQRLKELGVKQESLFGWRDKGRLLSYILTDYSPLSKDCSAFTVAELGEMLPQRYFSRKSVDGKPNPYCCLDDWGHAVPAYADTDADARAKMLIHLIRNGSLDVSQLS